jgi:hypothetical protein
MNKEFYVQAVVLIKQLVTEQMLITNHRRCRISVVVARAKPTTPAGLNKNVFWNRRAEGMQ